MSHKLSKEKIVTLKVLKPLGQSNVQIARLLGVTEGTVRYHLRRAAAEDGRRQKPRKADRHRAAVGRLIRGTRAEQQERFPLWRAAGSARTESERTPSSPRSSFARTGSPDRRCVNPT